MTRIITRTAIALLNKVANADRRYREQAKLRAMPVERLADMGMTPADIDRAYARPPVGAPMGNSKAVRA